MSFHFICLRSSHNHRSTCPACLFLFFLQKCEHAPFFNIILFLVLSQLLLVLKTAICFSTGSEANKANRQFKILKHILRAFMLRRTKALLIESGILELPPLTELTVSVWHYLSFSITFLDFYPPNLSKVRMVFAGWYLWHPYRRRYTYQCWEKSCKHFFHLLVDLLVINLCRTL